MLSTRQEEAPARQAIFSFENRAAGNFRCPTQLVEKRRRLRPGGEFALLVAVAGGAKHLPLGRHIPGRRGPSGCAG